MNNIIGKDLIVDINKVRPNTWNPKEGIEESTENKKHYEEIREEIRKKGLFEAITVREVGDEYEILDGYHRWTACKELGFTEIRINTLGEIDDKLARAITLIKEQKRVAISELKVAEVIEWYEENGEDTEGIKELLGYTDDVLKEYKDMIDFNWSEFKVEIGVGEEEGIDEKVEEGSNFDERKIVIKLDRENYSKVRARYEELGKEKYLDKLVNL